MHSSRFYGKKFHFSLIKNVIPKYTKYDKERLSKTSV